MRPRRRPGSGDQPGGTIIAGQGAVVTLDGNVSPAGHALFVNLGGDANGLSGGSRAAQYMLLKQALFEARSPERLQASDERLLTPLGRQTLLEFIERGSPFVFDVDRASDIRQVVAFARSEKLRAVIAGGAEAWLVAGELKSAGVPVLLDPLDNLPASFDKVGATLENAARLQKAGVTIAFSFRDPQAHNIRKIRQAAGNAVAHGLPPEAALAAMTRNPAAIFGVADRAGTLEVGRPADLVLWSGDPSRGHHARRARLHRRAGDSDAFAADRAARPLSRAAAARRGSLSERSGGDPLSLRNRGLCYRAQSWGPEREGKGR